nr:MAG TPA: hypothetical protein [Caudoviricetes sp.]
MSISISLPEILLSKSLYRIFYPMRIMPTH